MPSALLRRLVIVVSLVASLAAALTPALAEEAPPALRRDVGAYALFGLSRVRWEGALSMPLRASSGSQVLVEFPSHTVAYGKESFVAAPAVVARDASVLHFVYASTLDASADVVVEHEIAAFSPPLVAAADLPRAPAVQCGGADVTVDSSNSPLLLAPGRYATVTVTQDQVLRLAPGGRYEMCILRVRPGATVEAGTGTFVLLRDHLTTGARARITGQGACGARWIALAETSSPAPASAGFDFGQGTGVSNRALIEGHFFTPGRITMAQHNDYVGRFWGDRVDGLAASPVSRTLSDCAAPQCGDGVLDAGEQCDDGNNRDGDCCSAFCEVVAEGGACDDGLFCTLTDSCDAAGRCVGSGTPCQAPDGDANCSESCNEDTRACNGPDPEASPCDDGLFCNGADRCASGLCIAHEGSPCPGPDGDANCSESCDEAARTCSATDPVGAPCDDGRFCTTADRCDTAGTCSGGPSPCPGADGDGNCSESCDELADACTAFDAEGSPCSDDLFCTATDQCDGHGQCRGWGDPCSAGGSGPAGGGAGDGDADCSESCDEEDDSCTAPDLDGSPCSDGLACTVGERCTGGLCQATGLTSCDDFNPCTDEFCTPGGDCLREYNSAPCDDGNPCTTGDRCIRGACGHTGVVDCRDDDLCSSDTCDPTDGSCRHSWAPATTCHEMGDGQTRIDLGYSPRDGEAADRLTTSWRGAHGLDPTTRAELGDPSQGDPFSVCFYDESSGLPELAYRLDFDAATLGDNAWKRTWRSSDLVYKLKADSGTSQGVSRVRLVVDKDGSPMLKLRAGANVGCRGECRAKFVPPAPLADGRLFAMEPATTVQWVASTGACWSSRYEEAAENTEAGFRARTRLRRR